MEDVQRIEEHECMKCDKTAATRIKTSEDEELILCVQHEEELKQEIQEKIQDQFEGLSEDEIAEKIVKDGESII